MGHVGAHVEDLIPRSGHQRPPGDDGRHVVDVAKGAHLLAAPEDGPRVSGFVRREPACGFFWVHVGLALHLEVVGSTPWS